MAHNSKDLEVPCTVETPSIAQSRADAHECLQGVQSPSRQQSEVPCQGDTTSVLPPQAKGGGQDDGGSGPECTPPMSRIGLNDHKAGMEGLDRDRINQIILEASKGSKFYKNEVQKEKQVSARIEQMRAKMKCLSESQKVSALKTADREVERLEALRDLGSIIVHIDMDAFYAAVEMRDDPRLRNVPMAVGGNSMLSTSNYLARRFGVRAAMPGFIGRKLCPDLVIVPTNFAKYTRVAEQVRAVLVEYDPVFSPMGLDESYLNITQCVIDRAWRNGCPVHGGSGQGEVGADKEVEEEEEEEEGEGEDSLCICKGDREEWKDAGFPAFLWEAAQDIVKEIRQKIEERTSLTASAGIAPNKMLAKIASDRNKPNGQYFLPPTRDEVVVFIRELPIRKVPGIGKVTERMLNALEVTTCGDLYEKRALLHLLFSNVSFHYFLRVCLGIGSTDVDRDYQRKSISTERTFSELSKPDELLRKCKDLCESLSESLVEEGLKGRTVTLKLKTVGFKVLSRAVSLSKSVCSPDDLFKAASELLQVEIKMAAPAPLALRLMGVRLSNLEEPTANSLETFFKKGSTSEDQSQVGLGMEVPLQDRDEGPCSSGLGEGELYGKEEVPCSSLLTEHIAGTRRKDTTTSVYDHSEEVSVAGGEERVNCPICGMAIIDDNTALNQHIDLCLNRGTITQVAGCRTPPLGRAPAAPVLTQQPSSSSSSSSSSKGRKREQKNTPEKAKRSKVHSPTRTMKLDNYFK